jgi:hypothetical protein
MCTATTSDGSDERVELRITGSGFTRFYKKSGRFSHWIESSLHLFLTNEYTHVLVRLFFFGIYSNLGKPLPKFSLIQLHAGRSFLFQSNCYCILEEYFEVSQMIEYCLRLLGNLFGACKYSICFSYLKSSEGIKCYYIWETYYIKVYQISSIYLASIYLD